MKYIKSTKEQCEAYSQKVSKGENYQSATSKWAEVQEIKGNFYIPLHPKYLTKLEIVNQLPKIETNEEII